MDERRSYSSEARNFRAAKRAVYTVTFVGAIGVVSAKALPNMFEDHGSANTEHHIVLSQADANSYFTKSNGLATIPPETPTSVLQPAAQGPLPTLSPADVGSYFTSNSTGEQVAAPAPSVATEAATQPATEAPTLMPTDVLSTEVTTEAPTEPPTEPPTQEVVENTPVATQVQTEVPTTTEAPTEASTETPSPTMIPTQEPTLAPTNTPVPTDTPMPTATPTEVPTQTPTPKPEKTDAPTPDVLPTLSPDMSIPEQLKVVNPDYTKMDELAQANTKLYGDAAPQYLCLQGVRLTIDQVYPDMDSALRIPSAYLAKGVFEEYPNRFAELKITSRKQLYELPPGAILVYQPNPDGGDTYDYAGGIHNGHIEIVISNDKNGTVIVGSDHQNSLDDDLKNLQGDVSVFIPINHGDNAPTAETTPEVTAQATESTAQIADPLPVIKGLGEEAPRYYETADEYQKALKDTFNVDMEGYDKDHLAWVWELLWKTDQTNFPKLLEGNTYNYKPYSSDGSTSDNVSIQEGSQVDSTTGKETASVITLVAWPTKATFLAYFIHESAHGVQANQPDSVSQFAETVQQFNKQGAIDWYGGNAETVFSGVSDANENYAEAFRLYLMSYLLPDYNLSLLAVGNQNEANPFVTSKGGPYGEIMHKVLFQKLPKS